MSHLTAFVCTLAMLAIVDANMSMMPNLAPQHMQEPFYPVLFSPKLCGMASGEASNVKQDANSCNLQVTMQDICIDKPQDASYRWMFNSTSKKCQPFIGCPPKGAANNFDNLQSCAKTCDAEMPEIKTNEGDGPSPMSWPFSFQINATQQFQNTSTGMLWPSWPIDMGQQSSNASQFRIVPLFPQNSSIFQQFQVQNVSNHYIAPGELPQLFNATNLQQSKVMPLFPTGNSSMTGLLGQAQLSSFVDDILNNVESALKGKPPQE